MNDKFVKIETVVNGKVVETKEYKVQTKVCHVLRFKKTILCGLERPISNPLFCGH